MKKKRYVLNRDEFKEIEDMGYQVKEFSPYHFRVSKNGRDVELDIYPTSKTYCKKYENYTSTGLSYDDIFDLVESFLDIHSSSSLLV